MDTLTSYLKRKQERDQSKKPTYGMRKLSIGFVSCFLGCAIFMAPTGVHAETEAVDAPVAPVETQINEEKPTEAVEAPVAEVPTEEEAEETILNESQDAPAEAPIEREEAPVSEDSVNTEESEVAPSEEETTTAETNEATPAETDEATPVESKEDQAADVEEKEADAAPVVENEVVATEETLEVSDQVEPQELKNEAEATPISAETGVIKNVEITIGGADNGEKTTTVNPTASADRIDGEDTDLNLKARIDFDIPEGTRSGSTFDIEISDNVNFNGIVKEEKIKPIEYNGEEIAKGEKLDGDKRGYRYTFNEKIDDLTDIRVRLEYPLFIDPKEVPGDSEKETVKVTLAGEDGTVIGENSKDFAVEYEKGVFEVDPEAHTVTVSGSANITNVTENTYEHVIYVNPTGDQGLKGSHVEIKNQEYTEKYTDDYGEERERKKAYDGAIFDEDVKNSVKVYKIINKDNFNLSYDLIESNLEDVTSNAKVEIVDDLWGGPSYLKVDVNQENYDDSVYVVTYNGKRKPNQATKTNVEFTADSRKMDGYPTERVTDTNGGWSWTNEILFDDPKTLAEAKKVYNLGDRVWIDSNKNGIQDDDEVGLKDVEVTLKGDDILPVTIKTDENGNYKFKKLKDGTYTVEFTVPEGYEATTANATEGTDENNSDASVAEGAEIATATGTIQGKDNMNVDFGVIESEVKKGSFKETHVYITKDFEGNVIEDKTITEAGKSSEGTKDESYTSAKVDKKGYELVKVTADEGSDEVTISEDGKQVEAGNYVEEKELAVTYEYVKQPGRFVEHHIYKTVDKDGKVVSTDKTVNLPEDGQDPFEGYSSEAVDTKQRDEEGYTFKEATEIKLQNDESGETYTNYVPGKTLEKTYIYTKTKEEPVAKTGKFKETHVYITKDFEGNVIEDKTITEAGKSSEGTKDESYTSAKVDKEGYELVKVTADEGSDEVTISEDGKQVKSGNYVEDKELAVTYEYVKQPGRFVEHHIYKTVDKDGKVVSTDKTVNLPEDGQDPFEGYSSEAVSTKQRNEEGYTFKEATEIKLQNSESEETYTNYVPGKVLEKTYIYTKTQEEPAAKKGSFKETHVYKTLDFEGNVVEDKTITEPKDATSGTKDESYTSAKVDKDGYVFTKVTADQGSDEVTISEDGKQVKSGNYVEDKELAVTYEYVKQPGRFVEHHIYKTVDKDGKVVSTDKTVNLPEDGQDPFEGYSSEAVSTKQRDEEGYTFKEATEIKLQNDESEETYTNYVPGKTLEKTYVYVRTQEEPETPQEPETPVTPEKPEEPTPVTPTPNTPGEPTSWIPVQPADPKTPESPVKEEPKNPEPQTPEQPVEPNEPANNVPVAPVEPVSPETPVKEEPKNPEPKKSEAPVPTDKKREDKAPQTFDAGVSSYAGLAGLASGLYALIERKKRNRK